MKYIRILCVCIPVGMLLSGCYTKHNQGLEKAKTKAAVATTATVHSKLLPDYTKHNQGLHNANIKKAVATATPYITVQLIPDPNRPQQSYIQYVITDEYGNLGDSHWNGAPNNESKTSTLFTTTFPSGNDVEVCRTDDKHEVIIQGTATDGNRYAWRSDSKIYSDSNMGDSDVRWKSAHYKTPCQ